MLGIYIDGFPLLPDACAVMSSLVVANLPAFLQVPDFHFTQSFIKDSENSENAWINIRHLEKDCDELETQGLSIHFEVEQFILNTNTKVIGEQVVSLIFLARATAK